jgi:putative chitinase
MQITATAVTYLKRSPKQASDLPDNMKKTVAIGDVYGIDSYSAAENDHYHIDLAAGSGSWYIYGPHWQLPWVVNGIFTEANLGSIMPYADPGDISTYIQPINRVLVDFDIATPVRAAAFIAQVAHESGSLRYKEEIASGSAYEGRSDLGNTQPGDGRRYKGRGLIQLTGRANYREAGQAMGLPLESNPDVVVKDPYTNAAVAGWYWQSRNINTAADVGNFERVTRLINGGLNGYDDRLQFWNAARRVLGI